jgi:Zn-dependent protease with chaperone function
MRMVGRVICLTLLFWSGSRGAMLAWLLAFLTFVYLTKPQGRWHIWLMEIVTAVVIAILLDVGNPSMGLLNAFLRSTGADASFSGVDKLSSTRLSLWMSAIDRLRQPDIALLGAGGNGFVRLGLAFGQVFHPHNIVLQAATDWGVVGVGLLCWMAFRAWPWTEVKRWGDGNTTSGLGMALMVFLLTVGLLDAGLYHSQYLVFAAIAYALVSQPRQQMITAGLNRVKRIDVSRITVMIFLVGAVWLHWMMRDYRTEWPVSPSNRPGAVLSRH